MRHRESRRTVRGGDGGGQSPLTRKHCRKKNSWRQVSWLSSPGWRLLGPAGVQWHARPSGDSGDLQLRDSSRFARDSLFVPLWFGGETAMKHHSQSTVAMLFGPGGGLENCDAKIHLFFDCCNNWIFLCIFASSKKVTFYRWNTYI